MSGGWPIDLPIQRISSKDNDEFRRLLAAQSRAEVRAQEGLCWLEGPRLVQQFLQARQLTEERQNPALHWNCDTLVMSEGWLENQGAQEAWQRLLADLSCFVSQAVVLPDRLFTRLGETRSPAGLGLLISTDSVHANSQHDSEAGLEKSLRQGDGLILDAIQDPGNLGTLLRTAVAAGCSWVALTPGSTDPWSPKCLRAGLGAQFSLRLFPKQSPEVLASVADSSGLDLFAADPLLGQSVYAKPMSQRLADPRCLAWVFGQEGRGLSRFWKTHPDIGKVFIPQSRQMESLNVSVAAAVCLFERRRCLIES
jgi:TrmH family RNA methyltransferase